MNTIKLITLDARHRGYGSWKHFVRFKKSKLIPNNFNKYRSWCWEQWGPSKELSEFQNQSLYLKLYQEDNDCENDNWCWDVDFRTKEYRLLFKDDITASMFMLQFA